MSQIIYFQKSTRNGKKYMVTIFNKGKKEKTVHFGADGYSDYTKHKDSLRMKKYEQRHKSRENWTKSGIKTAGFWSKWLLWSKPTLKGAITYTSKRFNLKIKQSKPPLTLYKSKSKSTKRVSRRRISRKRVSRRSISRKRVSRRSISRKRVSRRR